MKIHIALGYTDMRRGFDGLAMLVQESLKLDPYSGQLFVFRGRRADLIKILDWAGSGLCLFSKKVGTGSVLMAWNAGARAGHENCHEHNWA